MFIQNRTFRPVIPMAVICYSGSIMMKFCKHINIFIQKESDLVDLVSIS